MSDLKENVDIYVRSQLKNYKHRPITTAKVIHDSILGSNLFLPYEVALLDLPLLQRLRRINQVDLVPLVFPSGNHNRFEHTLGVTVIAEKLLKALYRKSQNIREDYDDIFYHIRIAAIMHDCGHGPFSHLSEQIYKDFSDLKELREKEPKLESASPHEVLSYLVITSPSFKDFFKKEIATTYKVEVDLDVVGNIVIGHKADKQRAFMVDIINGAFDADKLDYIQRDSHFTGIKMVLDLERLFHTVDIMKIDESFIMSVDLSGVSTLEQIVFNKMMLFSTVYHHHKVRSAGMLVRSIFYLLKQGIEAQEIEKLNGLDFKSSADFLYLTDDDIYNLSKKETLSTIKDFADALNNRILPKRAIVLSEKTITNVPVVISNKDIGTDKVMVNKLISLLAENKNMADKFIAAVAEQTEIDGNGVPAENIWVDLPHGPKFKEASQCPIKVVGEAKGYKTLREIFPVDEWTKVFSENKWKGFLFTSEEYRKSVFESAIKVLKQIGIELNDFARILCKMDKEPIEELPSYSMKRSN